MKPNNTIYDFIAIGVGPMNLGLACLAEPIETLNGIFLDKRTHFNWHPGMLLDDTTLQIPFMADLVTLADPTSPFSFLNYLKEQGKIYAFYIKENFLLLRKEYNKYCQWVIGKLQNVYFNTDVQTITHNGEYYTIQAKCTKTEEEKHYKTRKLVLGTGTQPYLPKCCDPLKDKLTHSSQYLAKKQALQEKEAITVIGSGQSAAEIFYDLLQDIDHKGYKLNWITRSPRFFPLEYSKLTLEMTSPEYVDYFYNLPSEKRDHLIKKQKHLYKGINQDLIANIYDLIYSKKLDNTDVAITLRTNSELQNITYDDAVEQYYLELYQNEQEKHYQHQTKALVFATGYGYQKPKFLEGISNSIRWDKYGRYDVHRNYAIDHDGSSIFVQNAELHTHGFVTPDLGMASYRNSHIIESLTGKEHYKVEKRIAFQQFSVSEAEELKIEKQLL